MRTAIHTLLAVVTVGATTSHAAFVSQWKFDEASGTTATDTTGSFNGTLSGGAVFVAGGISGNAVSLTEATNSLVNMGTAFPGFTSGDFSISLWAKTTTAEIDSTFLTKQDAGSRNGYLLYVNETGGGGLPNKASFNVSESASENPTSTTSINDGGWHQVVGVFVAGGSHFVYVDGSPLEATTPSQSVVANSAPLLIGGVNVSGVPTALYTGLIDDVQVYNHALSSNDVQFLFDNPGQAIPEPTSLGLLGIGALGLLARRRR